MSDDLEGDVDWYRRAVYRWGFIFGPLWGLTCIVLVAVGLMSWVGLLVLFFTGHGVGWAQARWTEERRGRELRNQFNELRDRFDALTLKYQQLATQARRLAGKKHLN